MPGARVPTAVRIAAAVWLAVWFPAYLAYYGWANFLHLSDLAVILGCAGLIFQSALLVSSQAVHSLVIDGLWVLDVLWRLVLGRHLIGGTEYMWDATLPLWLRLLSLFHVALPAVLLWSVHKLGYDRRGFALQAAIAAAALPAARLGGPAKNINFAFRDPIFKLAWGPAPAHLAVIYAVLVAVIYLPTHLLLRRMFSRGTGTRARAL
jgi:hypothetical protein